MSGVVTPALTPSLTDDILDTYENFQGAETIDGMVNLFVPPELMQHRSKYAVLPFHVGDTTNKIDADTTNWMIRTKYQCSNVCKRYCIREPKYEDTGKPPVFGRRYTRDPYPSKGFVMYLPITASPKGLNFTEKLKFRTQCTSETLNFYLENGWLDRSTRMVELSVCAAPFTSTAQHDFGGYDVIDAVACFNLNFEIDRYGAWHPKHTISSGTSFVSDTYREYTKGLVLYGSIVPAIIMLLLEFNEILVKRFGYFSFSSFWNYLDIIISVMAITFAGKFNIDVVHSLDGMLYDDVEATQLGVTMTGLSNVKDARIQYGWLMFIMFLRLVKYISINARFELPVLTLIHSFRLSIPILIFLGIWAVALGFLMHGLFGAELTSFNTVMGSMTTMNRMFLGDVDFDQFDDTDYSESGVNIMAIFGSITLYIVFTMFVSIIDEAYTAQLEIVTKRDEDYEKTESYTYSEKLFDYANKLQRRFSFRVQQQIEEIEEELVELTDNDAVDDTSSSKYVIKDAKGDSTPTTDSNGTKPKEGSSSNLKSIYLPNENKN